MAFSGIQAETVKFQGFNGDSGEVYYARASATGEYPGVVVIHHFPGWDEWTAEVVRKFADHGYAAIAPSLQRMASSERRGRKALENRREGNGYARLLCVGRLAPWPLYQGKITA
jgi:carboxymethylenebutenolidase